MPIRRIFFDWARPALVGAAEYLIERFATAGGVDLEDVVVAVPGGRAGRRLLEILVDLADRRGLVLVPPRIVTAGGLPELLYQAKRPFADPFVQQLAWIEALKRSEPEHLDRLALAGYRDGEAGGRGQGSEEQLATPDFLGQLAVGEMLGRLHGELAADGLSCEDVAERGAAIEEFREADRWRSLAHVQDRYLTTLDSLELWDRQTARLYAIQHKECRTDAEVILVGTVDLNLSQRQMLDQVAERVTALVFAPDRLADHFDAHGCLRPDKWLQEPIPLSDEQIEVVDDPADQASAVVQAIAAMDGRYRAEDITVGVPDERIIPYVQQQLEQCGVATRYGAGVPIAESPPRRLLAAVADYLESRGFAALAALVRHPAVDAWLAAEGLEGDWLSRLDQFHAEHLPFTVDRRRLAEDDRSGLLGRLIGAVDGWLGELAESPRPLDQWGRPIVNVLLTVFGRAPLDPSEPSDRMVLVACEKIHAALASHASVPAGLAPKMAGADAVRLVLRQIATELIAPLPDRDAVELLGWLELAMDDAPALVVTGLSEGIVPSSLNADMFLPNRLRRALELEDNHRRYARDAYALSVLAASRKHLTLIAGRTAPEGEPLYPSRLLFACDAETTARRVTRFFHPADSDAIHPAGSDPIHRVSEPADTERPHERGHYKPAFVVPPPKPLAEPVTSMRVTEFRDYLACPYRYYLRHQLKLESLGDQAEELDAPAFGSLLHNVLGDFGKSEVQASSEAAEIEAFLSEQLDRLVGGRYGKAALPAVRVQVEQLRARLAAFARWQAGWAADGWRIEMVETGPPDGKASLVVDDKPMFLRGRIDRIDRHEATGRRIIFDYKSSDTAASPDATHRSGDSWVDLQLPLYRHLASGMDIAEPPELGYIVVPKDTSRVGPLLAEWSKSDLDDADQAAADVIRGVRNEVFWPPAVPPPRFFDELAAICQDEQFGSPDDETEGA